MKTGHQNKRSGASIQMTQYTWLFAVRPSIKLLVLPPKTQLDQFYREMLSARRGQGLAA